MKFVRIESEREKKEKPVVFVSERLGLEAEIGRGRVGRLGRERGVLGGPGRGRVGWVSVGVERSLSLVVVVGDDGVGLLLLLLLRRRDGRSEDGVGGGGCVDGGGGLG